MTPQDFAQFDKLLQKRLKGFATKEDLKDFATKEDLKKELSNHPTRKEVFLAIDDAVAEIITAVDKSKADKVDLTSLDQRVTRLEHKLS